MTTQNTNHFSSIPTDVQAVPQQQRPQRLIDEICEQMLTSDNPQVQQYATELQQVKPQIVKALQA